MTVLEKEDHVAAHQSGHNSGVVHAGVYYPPGSLKATLCRRGAAMTREFCQEHGVRFRELGKLIVAVSDPELVGLAKIEDRATQTRFLASGGCRALRSPTSSPASRARARCTRRIPRPSITRPCPRPWSTVINAVGGKVLLGTAVSDVRETAAGVQVLSASGERFEFDYLVVCAGLNGDQFAASLNRSGDLRIVPFRGEYYELAPDARDKVRGMVYPVPDPRYPFLGVHLTRHVDDTVHVGPNAVLALALQGYRWSDINLADLIQIGEWPGTWRLARRHWRSGVHEISASLSKRRYLARVRAYLPDLQLADLVRSKSGVRAQAVRRDGSLEDDFVLQADGRVLLVRNAPSPAATASLAIAEHIVSAIAP